MPSSYVSTLSPLYYSLLSSPLSSLYSHYLNMSTMSTEWSLDFCLACDRQTSGGPYCSQSCRLAELDRPVSEDSFSHTSHSRSSTLDSTPNTRSTRSLSASSSQTSLSTLKSHSSDPTIADQLQDELRDYASSFDPVRDLKRRLTTS